MHNSGQATKNDSRDGDLSQRSLSVVAIYEGYQAEMRVNQAFAWLHHSFRSDLRISFNSWNFGKLEAALDTRAMSIRIGRAAEMIIIATSCVRPLPDQIRRWMEDILGQQREERALLVALEDNDHFLKSHTDTICEQVQQAASRWQADFMCCENLQQPMNRQFILRFINERFHDSVVVRDHLPECEVTDPESPYSLKLQTMNQSQSTMTPSQIQEIRGLAYQLWLQADRPAGKEIDFWLQAEEQIHRAAAEYTTCQALLNAATMPKSVIKKTKVKTTP